MNRKDMINQIIQSYIDHSTNKDYICITSGLPKRDVDNWCKANNFTQKRVNYGNGIIMVTIHRKDNRQ